MEPDHVPHGWVRVHRLSPGHALNFQCDEGYSLSGDALVVCLDGERWRSPFPTCQRRGPEAPTTCTQTHTQGIRLPHTRTPTQTHTLTHRGSNCNTHARQHRHTHTHRGSNCNTHARQHRHANKRAHIYRYTHALTHTHARTQIHVGSAYFASVNFCILLCMLLSRA